MRPVDVAIADGDPISLKRNVEGLRALEGIRVVTSTADGAELIESLRRIHADVVMTGLALRRVDGFCVLEAIGMMNGERPKSLVLTSLCRDSIMERAVSLGADYCMVKPVDVRLVYRRICQLAESMEEAGEPCADAACIPEILRRMGISAGKKGYHCLITACRLAEEAPEALECLTGKLYPMVAERMGMTNASVERAIRTTIQYASERNGFLKYNSEIGETLFHGRNPSAGELIRYLCGRARSGK